MFLALATLKFIYITSNTYSPRSLTTIPTTAERIVTSSPTLVRYRVGGWDAIIVSKRFYYKRNRNITNTKGHRFADPRWTAEYPR